LLLLVVGFRPHLRRHRPVHALPSDNSMEKQVVDSSSEPVPQKAQLASKAVPAAAGLAVLLAISLLSRRRGKGA
jgi:hypothetical protein